MQSGILTFPRRDELIDGQDCHMNDITLQVTEQTSMSSIERRANRSKDALYGPTTSIAYIYSTTHVTMTGWGTVRL
jgi:hypothetical protein